MPIKCPPAPVAANPALVIQTAILKAGSALTRFHSKSRAGNIYNPNTGKRIEIEEEGARFNPFPGAPAANVPTLYAADNITAAALESIFHGVKHIPSPTFPRIGLKDSSYSELVVNADLAVVELTNPQLRQLVIARRRTSLKEEELIHTPPSQYPHTRTWARFLHDSLPSLQGLCWRPRLGGTGLAYMLFGDRCAPGALTVTSGPTDVDSGSGQSVCDCSIGKHQDHRVDPKGRISFRPILTRGESCIKGPRALQSARMMKPDWEVWKGAEK